MVRVIGIGVAATLVAALAAGCGGSNPKPAPVSSPSGSASASPSVAPTMPAEAKGTTAASAEAFVRYYIDVFNYATRTGDTATFLALGTGDCTSCKRLSERIDKIYAAGGTVSGDLDEVVTTRANGPVVIARLKQLPQVTTASSAGPAKTAGPGSFRSKFTLSTSATGWLMRDWSLL